MEEVSSLDSFHTDDGESITRAESEPTKLDEETTQSSADKTEAAEDKTTNEPKRKKKPIDDFNDEDEFEKISEGSFEVDDNSQVSAANMPPPPDDTSQEKLVTESGHKKIAITEKGDKDAGDETGANDSADFEEVDATVSANASATAAEEDMLGESDMTLPSEVATETQKNDKSDTGMEVDNEDGDENEPGDVEMASASNSPNTEKQTSKSNEATEQQNNDSFEGGSSKDEVDGEGDQAKGSEANIEIDDDANADDQDENAETEGAIDNADDIDHEDEPVENVQEPEESDVCLIPDDTETEMTEAEKEQAILARENAEKEDAAAEAEKEKEAEAAKAKKALESGDDGADDDLNETAPAADAQDADEPLLEEMQSAVGETGTVSKVIIGWIVSITKTCKQCGKEKSCGFRFKNPENSEMEYICEQACCDALLASSPGKYFIRRKKYLVEELTNDSQPVVVNEAENDSENADNDSTEQCERTVDDLDKYECLQCKEMKMCKYFFKQDDEMLYVCNDDCFNLLSAEEPDKFKLKRHSIRVRNIGATLAPTGVPPSKKQTTAESRVVARTAAEAEAARLERVASFTRQCAECFKEIVLGDKNLLWETMDFCNEICLGKYQRTFGSNCQTCQGEVPHPALGKYCVRFGFDIRQFCCAPCLNEYKKGLKTCSCCQKDISSGSEGFLAPVGDKEQFKDFCSQACMRRYDNMCNPKKKLRNDVCAVCSNEQPVRAEILLDDKEHNFCSNPCFSAFKFVSNIVADQCGMCCKFFERKGSESFTIYTERRAKVFCSRICLNVYIIVNRRIVSCHWCKVKKYNFDMIYKQHDGQEILMCSLNCLTLYGVSINAFSRTVAKCDNCNNSATPQYHLTMSDASMRNFCTYQCVMQFQSQFARAPLTLETETSTETPTTASAATATTTAAQQSKAFNSKNGVPFPTGLPKRVKLKAGQNQPPSMQLKLATKNSVSNKKVPTMPIISTVASLASGETETMIGNVTVRRSRGRGRKLESPPPLVTVGSTSVAGRGRPRKTIDFPHSPTPPSASPPRVNNKRSVGPPTPPITLSEKLPTQTETKIITVPPYPPAVRNMQVSCRPQTVTVGFQTEPATSSTSTQTGKDYSNKVLIPVPVPIYVPQPMYMYSAPFPVPVPIPLPIPVPIFIPTTRNSAQGILKEIKKIQDKMPADPFEAELLMMAEMVAEEKRESDSDSDDDIKPEPSVVPLEYGNSVPVEVANNSYGEDVLQMALKMATGEYDQPTVDLESAMTANTITNPPPGLVVHDDAYLQQHHMMEPQRGGRGRKRGSITSPVAPRNNRSPVKRARLQELETTPLAQPQPMQPIEKPDANMCLKYTFGVNAWKQWVMTKNADIEKSTIRRRTFKTELLQMTADELNYSLCLFVKEVRKPNGTEYAPDTIYYLVLGIQQYLYENGRIDNIFTDPYYDRFTDCLDEVARKFSVLYNDSQYIVTRVEEEHLWESKQLGAHSPHVLLSTLMFFNTKHFNLTTVEEHMQLSFSHIMKHWKRTAQNAKSIGTRNVLLRFYPPQAGLDANPRKKKVYEQQENEENPLRCPVRLYEFYLSKCPESVKTRNDVFYLQPERSCVPDSPVWYSTQALSQDSLQKMLHRVKMVKEINIALLTS